MLLRRSLSAAVALLNVAALASRMVRAGARSGEREFPREWFRHDNDDRRARHAALLGKPMPRLEPSRSPATRASSTPPRATGTARPEEAYHVLWYPTYADVDQAGKLRATGGA